MVGLPSRHRSLFLLGGVVLLQVLLLAVQIKRDSQGRLIRVWTVGAVSPFERAGAHGISHIRDTWNHYFALQNTSRENEELKRENGTLKSCKSHNWKVRPGKPIVLPLAQVPPDQYGRAHGRCASDRRQRGLRQPNHLPRSRRARRHPPEHGGYHCRTAWSAK